MRRKSIAALCLAALLLGSGCAPAPIVAIPTISHAIGEVPLRVAAPEVPTGVDPQDGVLVAEVYATALNAAGAKAEVIEPATSAGTAPADVAAGKIDIAPVFSRPAMAGKLPAAQSGDAPQSSDAPQVLAALKESLPSGVELLNPAKAQDKTSMVVTAVTAEKYQLKSSADLAGICEKLVMGGPAVFHEGPNGLAELGKEYNCIPARFKALAPTANYSDNSMLWALLQDDIQIAVMSNSSPAIADNALVVLSDPKNVFPVQDLVPVVSTARVSKDVQAVVDKVSATLTDGEVANLSRLAQDRHFGTLAEAADAWLVQKGLVEAGS